MCHISGEYITLLLVVVDDVVIIYRRYDKAYQNSKLLEKARRRERRIPVIGGN
jgi:isochorismate hydrolase